MKNILFFFLFSIAIPVFSQEYTSSNIHAHNDYANPIPFYEAFSHEVGSMEVDVFLKNNELYVAHTETEMATTKTLRSLYLKPLMEKIENNKGVVYKDNKPLTLLIDLKTEGIITLNVLVKQLAAYPQLLAITNFHIVITGNVPDPSQWDRYPSFIYFDGRPAISYTDAQLKRIDMISNDLKDYTQWNGKGILTKVDHEKLDQVIKTAHAQNKKIRFWSTPDNVNAWIALMKLGVNYIGSDQIVKLASFIADKKKSSFLNQDFYETYIPMGTPALNEKIKAKNIILLIGDGMGLTQLYAGYTANKGELNIFNIPTIGFSITKAADSYITDSAAGATAMATGHKTNNRFIGVDTLGKPLELITKKLALQGYQSAIISSGDMTDATPAAFYAHQSDRSYNEAITADFLNTPSDILIGGGQKPFQNPKADHDIISVLQKQGYVFAKNFGAIDTIKSKRFLVLDDAAVVSKLKGRGDFLTKAIQKSLTTFSTTQKPFFMMAEGAQIDYGGHSNDLEYVVRELLDFDRAVGAAMKFVDNNKETLLIVTADHETGGLSLLDGDINKGYVAGHFSTNDHTAVMVPIFAYGVGADHFKGVYQNTEIFNKIMELSIKKTP